jgi:hypothetical protein
MKIDIEEGIELMVDNKSAINLAKNPIAHGRRKHIETKFHFLKDQVTKLIYFCLISNFYDSLTLSRYIISFWT